MNRRRKISNRFVTKIEDDFFFRSPPFSSPPPPSPSSLAAHNGVVVRFVARCCDDATGTYIVIMWHGCRSRVVGSHQEALSYGERGLHPRAPCEAYTERASGLARGTPPYARHSAPRDSTRSLALLLARPTTSGSRALLVRLFRKGGGGGEEEDSVSSPPSLLVPHRNHRPSELISLWMLLYRMLSVLLLIGESSRRYPSF